jgi:hypothetical protein
VIHSSPSMKTESGAEEGVRIEHPSGGQPALRHISRAVGIVWSVRDGSGPRQLVIDSTPLVEAEPYGDFLTHPRGHYEVWEGWRRLGLSGLASRRLPTVIAWHEYEHFPRGRVVFDTRSRRFTLYADRKLQGSAMLVRMLSLFGLDPVLCAVRSDPHYRTAPDDADGNPNTSKTADTIKTDAINSVIRATHTTNGQEREQNE